MKSNRSVLKV